MQKKINKEEIEIRAIRSGRTEINEKYLIPTALELYNTGLICKDNMLILATLPKKYQQYCLIEATYLSPNNFQHYFPRTKRWYERFLVTKLHPKVLLSLKMGEITYMHMVALIKHIPIIDQPAWLERACKLKGDSGVDRFTQDTFEHAIYIKEHKQA